jgi:hypothetical protein
MDFMDKLVALEKAIAAEKGAFVLFAVVQREDVPDRWDLLLSAPWFGPKEAETLDFFVHRLRTTLTPQELVQISRIILFPPNDPRVHEIRQLLGQPVAHGHVERSMWSLAGMPVRHAHIVTAADVPVFLKCL